MFEFLARAPYIRICLPLMAGILLQWKLRLVYQIPELSCLYLIAILFAMIILLKQRGRWLSGLFMQLTILLLGILILQSRTHTFAEQKHLLKDRQSCLLASVDSEPKVSERFVRLTVRTQGLLTEDADCETYERSVSVFLPKDSISANLQYGDQLVLYSRFDSLRPTANDYDFDYQLWQSYQNIYSQSFVKSGEWCRTGINTGQPLLQLSSRLRSLFTERINKLVSEEARGIAMAMLLGNKQALAASTYASYSESGAMHVLAVSGLHVGFVAMLLGLLLGFLDRGALRYLRLLLLLSGMGLFACITGASPSVIRATLMFSLFAVGMVLNRFSNSYNTLACAAVLLLIFRPLDMMQAGFHLSFAAVIGIVSLQKHLEALLQFKHPLMRWLWSMTTVSLGAQIGTLPFSLYYFHQLPSYALISNCIVIPAAAAILALGLPLIMLPQWSILTSMKQLLAGLLSYLIESQNAALAALSELPGSAMTGIFLNEQQLLLCYLGIFALSQLLISRKIHFLKVALAASLLCFVWNQRFSTAPKESLIIHHHKHFSLLEHQAPQGSNFYYHTMDTLGNAKARKLGASVASRQWHYFSLDPPNGKTLSWQNPLIRFADYNILWLRGDLGELQPESSWELADLLYLSTDFELRLDDIAKGRLSGIVLDGSNSYRYRKRIKLQAEKLAIPVYDTAVSGQFRLEQKRTDQHH